MILPVSIAERGFIFKKVVEGGGQSHTYLIEKENQLFLLKQPLAEKLSTEQKFRFKQEAKALELIDGNGTPKVISFDFDSDNPFILMEFIDGKTLSQIVNGKPLEMNAAFDILNSLVKIISRIHEMGMQHRDIKPDNIIIKSNNDVVLIDFGLCRIENKIEDFKTPNGKELGNRFLRLPELGKGQKISSSVSDVTFLIGIFYYMLTGKHPNQLLDENHLAPHRRLNDFKDIKWLNYTFDKGFAYPISQRFQTADELISFINLYKNKLPLDSNNDFAKEFEELLNSHTFNRLNEILESLINFHEKFNLGLEQAIGINVRTNGVSPQIDGSGFAVQTEMFILPAKRQNPRIWWKNKSTVSRDLTSIVHTVEFEQKILLSSTFAITEMDRMNDEYYEMGNKTGKVLLQKLVKEMNI